jgi:hypothetical protein
MERAKLILSDFEIMLANRLRKTTQIAGARIFCRRSA